MDINQALHVIVGSLTIPLARAFQLTPILFPANVITVSTSYCGEKISLSVMLSSKANT
jgi:hypothetical protein